LIQCGITHREELSTNPVTGYRFSLGTITKASSKIQRDPEEIQSRRSKVSSRSRVSDDIRLLKNPDSRLFKKVQMRGAREIDERRRIY
jgi:hypothetical protein